VNGFETFGKKSALMTTASRHWHPDQSAIDSPPIQIKIQDDLTIRRLF
jgi:hypothetical protein